MTGLSWTADLLRSRSRRRTILTGVICAGPLLTVSVCLIGAADESDPTGGAQPNPSGAARTFTSNGFVDTRNPFFQPLGTNGRACVTCHQPSDGWSITPPHVQARFDASDGLDPLFRTNDGSVAPDADVSTVEARRSAYGMLLSKAVIRVGMSVPADADFELASAVDPYGYASMDGGVWRDANNTSHELSLFRRSLPSTNLRFLSAVMWDGRETVTPITGSPTDSKQALLADLAHQAQDATLGHAAALTPGLTAEQQEEIVKFETGLSTAQVMDDDAGELHAQGGNGGPYSIPRTEFFIGINDPLGSNPSGAPFNPAAFTLYDSWSNLQAGDGSTDRQYAAARESVARGETIFNTRPIPITGVGGLNDALHQPVIMGTCTTCHDTPNVGNHSVSAPLNIGLSDPGRRTPDLPLYTFRNKATGQVVQTTDPGRALISGKWKDIGKFKGPILRGLAARAPYFHNGSAASLSDVVDFYNSRFTLSLSPQERADLVAFLRAL